MRRLLTLSAGIYVAAFLLEGCLAVADAALRLGAHSGALGAPRGVLGFTVACYALLLYLAAFLFRALPVRVFGPAILFPFVAGIIVTPVAVSLASPLSIAELVTQRPDVVAAKAPWLLLAMGIVGLVQVGVGAWTMRAIGRASPDGSRLFLAGTEPAPPRSWRYALGFVAVNGLLLAVGGPLYMALTLIVSINSIGRGYIACDHSQIALVQKDLVREGKTVSLVGMMHIGEESFYTDLVDSIDPKGAVLLAEGVSDRKSHMRGALQYREMASSLGLTPQVSVFAPQKKGLEVVHADVDVDEFTPGTIEILNGIAEIHGSQKKDLREVLKLQLSMSDPAVIEALFRDIVDLRNEHLLGMIDRSLADHQRIVVPWGALHLHDIELALLAKGFTVAATQSRTVVRFATIRERLLAPAPALTAK